MNSISHAKIKEMRELMAEEEKLICQKCGKVVRCLHIYEKQELCFECWLRKMAGE